jgi:hypothetical protein
MVTRLYGTTSENILTGIPVLTGASTGFDLDIS